MWQKVKKQDYSIDYVDPPESTSRGYGPGRLTFKNGDVSFGPEPRQLAFVKWFGVFFIPFFSLIAYFFIPGNVKWPFVIAGPFLGTLTFGMIYYFIKQDVDAGPYIEFISSSNEIALPRLEKRFSKDQVTLQWITGIEKNDHEVTTDLNLIVQEEDGSKYRFHVMSGPYRKYVKRFAEHAQIPVIEVNMGWKGRRDTDRETA